MRAAFTFAVIAVSPVAVVMLEVASAILDEDWSIRWLAVEPVPCRSQPATSSVDAANTHKIDVLVFMLDTPQVFDSSPSRLSRRRIAPSNALPIAPSQYPCHAKRQLSVLSGFSCRWTSGPG